ncbi:DNA-binding transcription factor, sexual differentiation inducing Esc1 [Schizosaccharomyces pombe]|uniref:Protein esc1 n=1 Tax=Schizosaccharomyces pombe (strain 972 / ATCC 24843) TaxID=284812 RepID=ESC1_SCHPO|nr:putative transcription factor Esc1 [Schizosaccharomyces pombe]Q04635.1 RecName: Full=Protein esc1 [Schizosaccharomyces pombe 972h-]CAA49186.1 Esc1 [Schizosaccharomyces pombe]CAA93587.1 transcription factor Esc1 (predicted) [Schizosaccharomyces pombe]|eukprot:NP_593230.1 putative transcription factor Esc1 [Schizosaccharomyces pombe]
MSSYALPSMQPTPTSSIPLRQMSQPTTSAPSNSASSTPYSPQQVPLTHNSYPLSTPSSFQHGQTRLPPINCLAEPFNRPQPWHSNSAAPASSSPTSATLSTAAHPVHTNAAQVAGSSSSYVYSVPPTNSTTSQASAKHSAVPHRSSQFQSTTLTPSTTDSSSTDVSSSDSVSTSASSSNASNTVSVTSPASSSATPLPNQPSQQQFLVSKNDAFTTFVHSVHNTPMQQSMYVPQQQTSHSSGASYQNESANPPVQSPMQYSYSQGQPFSYPQHKNQSFSASPIDPSMSYVYRAPESFSSINANVPYGRNEYLRRVTSLVPNQPEYTGPYTRNPELRTSHKLAERKRRKEIKELFDDLKDALPLDKSTKSSKWGLLTRAIQYIEQLKSEQVALEAYVKSLEENMQSNKEVTKGT